MVPILGPRQLGVGVAGGCEGAIHAARRYLETMPEDHILVKLDFSNAFNCLHRRNMLLAVQQHVQIFNLSVIQLMLTLRSFFTVSISVIGKS